jgi:hypothetical protein
MTPSKQLTVKPAKPKLPPIAVDDRTEKISLTIPVALKRDMERFGKFFIETTGQTPTSFNAVAIGILTVYLSRNVGFQKWLEPQRAEQSTSS